METQNILTERLNRFIKRINDYKQKPVLDNSHDVWSATDKIRFFKGSKELFAVVEIRKIMPQWWSSEKSCYVRVDQISHLTYLVSEEKIRNVVVQGTSSVNGVLTFCGDTPPYDCLTIYPAELL